MESWSLFCPNEAPGLKRSAGERTLKLYISVMKKKGGRAKTIKAQELWFKILESQIETETLTWFTKMLAIGNRISKT